MSQPLVEMNNIHKRFGGIHAVEDMSLELHPGEVVGLLGHNGAGKSTFIKMLSGAYQVDSGEILIDGQPVQIRNPIDAKELGIETIYQTLALADNLDTAANIFFGREILTPWGALDEPAMEHAAIGVMKRLNPQFRKFHDPVSNLSGGQRQSVAIARALQFNARIIIMDEPTAALGPHETQMVADLIKALKKEGIAIVMISHDLHDVFDLSDRIAVMKNGRHVWTGATTETDKDQVLQMVILGKLPDGSYAPGILTSEDA
ncbi:ATP-binding cassette domain-containing protein [Rhodobacteraceae bacterium 2CG4]|uniref:ATP-binding cassette domain-containing protein n=1 Tax=Halovulum marinum TaxID=2662447 RepID=A0A6L5Z3Z3_9RHOB|nr:ATP-binding cassette domain-containing protein [Halovulum marinum]MSU91268.1 ATP-binding cassette domain-containing protein [Halovulum marinum]